MLLGCFGLFIVICHAQISQALEQCHRSTYSEYGHHLSGHVVSTRKTSGVTECVMICSSESRCKSLNFRLKDKSCDLNDANKDTHPRDFGPKEGSVYMNTYRDDEFKSCTEILNKWPHAESGYYWINIGNRNAQVYCDMEKHGGGWTLVVSISSKNNDHLQSAANNCLNPLLCVPFTDQDQGRKMGDNDIHELAKKEGTFRVDVLRSDGTFLRTVFYQIPSGPNKFNSSCHQGNCPRIIISHSFPYHWETNNCTRIDVGYRIWGGCHWGIGLFPLAFCSHSSKVLGVVDEQCSMDTTIRSVAIYGRHLDTRKTVKMDEFCTVIVVPDTHCTASGYTMTKKECFM